VTQKQKVKQSEFSLNGIENPSKKLDFPPHLSVKRSTRILSVGI